MFDANTLVDNELMVSTLLKRDIPDAVIAAELDVESIDETPMVMFMATTGEQRGGPGLWSTTFTVDVFALDSEQAFQLCIRVYDAIHAWDMPGGSDTEWGYVNRVVDLSSFTRLSTQFMQGKHVTQYAATFVLIIRNP